MPVAWLDSVEWSLGPERVLRNVLACAGFSFQNESEEICELRFTGRYARIDGFRRTRAKTQLTVMSGGFDSDALVIQTEPQRAGRVVLAAFETGSGMATDQPKEKTRLLSDLEKSALAQAEQPSEQGWYPDPLRAGEGTERFFSTEPGQWTGRTRGDHKAPKRDLSQSVGSVSVSAQEIQASALIRDIEIKQLTDDEAVWSYLIGKQVFANILDPDEWSIAILAQVTKSFLIFRWMVPKADIH